MNLKEAREDLKIAESVSDSDWAERFSEERYMDEGPGKHQQEDEGVPFSIMEMYSSWASELFSEYQIESSPSACWYNEQTLRFLCERIYAFCGFGMMGVEDDQWEHIFPDTLSAAVVRGLTSSPPDPKLVQDMIDKICPTVSLLLDAGVEIDKIITAVRDVPAKTVHES